MRKIGKYLLGFVISVIVIFGMALLGPEEKTLGSSVRIVYLHGAWVLAAEAAFIIAALVGLAGLLTRRESLHRWSKAVGLTGICMWITYLPLSMWAMQANWNGLFLSEPRFRLAVTFAVVGLLLQVGLGLINKSWLTSAANIIFLVALRISFSQAAYVMHPPPSPIFNSGNALIIGFFLALNLVTFVAGYFLTRWWESLGISSSVSDKP